MPDMDENNEIEQQVSDGDSSESPKNKSAPAEGQEPESTPEEQEKMGMAEEASGKNSAAETPDSPDVIPDNSSEAAEGSEIAGDDMPPPDSGESDNLLDQSDIDKVLKENGADEDNSDIPFDVPADNIGGLSEPEVKQADFQQLSAGSPEGEPKNIELLMDVELPISIELGKTTMNIADILGLAPGSIVELDKLVGEPVDLLVNQRCVAKGEVVVVEENFGLRITQLVSPEERLRNLQ